MDKKSVIYGYLKQNKYMSLATCSKQGSPEVATVEYVLDGDELIINTYVYYRKYQNLIDNPKVACVVTTDHEITLQFEGKVEQLEGDEASRAKQKMLEFDPSFAEFFSEKDSRFFKIYPTWMRLRDYAKEPLTVVEYIP